MSAPAWSTVAAVAYLVTVFAAYGFFASVAADRHGTNRQGTVICAVCWPLIIAAVVLWEMGERTANVGRNLHRRLSPPRPTPEDTK